LVSIRNQGFFVCCYGNGYQVGFGLSAVDRKSIGEDIKTVLLNRLLDQNDTSLTLTTLTGAAAALGKKLKFELVPA
jgi:hypothetical protein